jgi:hypothetical protein
MKKLSLIFAVAIMMAVVFVSCNKKDDAVNPNYASTVSGEVIIQNGDITLKSAPIGVTRYLYMYKQLTAAPTFALVDGSEFLAGSAPAIFWATPGNNPGNFPSNVSVYSNYTPAIQIRMVAKTVDASNKPAYLGIWDGLPSAASFPVTIEGRRLGDVLTLNTDALTSLPGYTNMSFSVSYDKGIINVENTAVTSGPTTSGWPTYAYSSTVNVVDQVVTGTGDQVVYDDVDAKILGTITIKIHVDATTITKTVSASSLGHGMAITLTTTRAGWFDSGTMTITDKDVVVDTVNVPVN